MIVNSYQPDALLTPQPSVPSNVRIPSESKHNTQHENPFTTAPAVLSEVTCTPPDCPLLDESIHQLNIHLSQTVDLASHSMLVHRKAWVEALEICSNLW